MNPITDPSLRRYSVLLAGVIATLGNKNLGLDLDPNQLSEFLLFLGTYILASNGKEAIVARANASAKAAAEAVVPGAAADAKLDALAKGGTP